MYETWAIVPREEDRLKVFENRVLRKVFAPKTEEETEGWRKFYKLYS
jgi:hypothetical protein